ncbi:MAG: hypothetical protein IPN22_02340 [Bacteroidetes bacterium]|nr:hypothetical protein [Bacteroidota bacterium]
MTSSENYLAKSVAGTFGVVAALLILSFIPEFDFFSFHFRPVNILADVQLKENPKPTLDTAKKIRPVFADTCKQGLVCIEDYSSDTSGLSSFLQALDSSGLRKVRIAWFGDSFVEGDIFLDPLRDTLQAIYGGSGVGFVPISSEVAGFRQTISHTFSGWNSSSIIGEKTKSHPLGFAGSVFWPSSKAMVKYAAVKKRRLSNFEQASLFLYTANNNGIYVNGTYKSISASNSIQKLSIGNNLKSLELEFSDSIPLDVYGVSLESKTGLAVDNFSMRGNSGIGLSYVSSAVFKRMSEIHSPDLVVLSYGLNVANPKSNSYDWYVRSMTKTILMIKESFPNSSILLIGCPDRGENKDGVYQTMRGVNELIQVQRKMAAETGICFWDMHEAMGGDSTMIKWGSMKKHPYANKDYTHLTFYGGEKMANITAGTIFYEKEKYDRKKSMLNSNKSTNDK